MNSAFSTFQRGFYDRIAKQNNRSNKYITMISSNINGDDNANDNDNDNANDDNIGANSRGNKKRKPKIQWITCSSTKEVKSAIDMYVKEGDIAVELGSQLRESSTTLCDAIGSTGRALLVDVVRKFPKVKKNTRELKRMTAMRMEGEEINFYTDRATFVEIKSFDSWRRVLFFRRTDDGFFKTTKPRTTSNDANEDIVAQIEPEESSSNPIFPKYNVLVLDASVISGNDMALNCVSIVKEFLALNDVHDGTECVVIIKSSKLNSLARKLIHGQRLFSGSESLEGRRDNGTAYTTTNASSIIATVGVEEYRRTIAYAVEKGDAVLEIGSHFGTTTALLHAAATSEEKDILSSLDFSGGCLGVDIGPHIIERAQKKYPHVPFCVGDAWRTSNLIQMKKQHLQGSNSVGYDVVYVDVGGLSGSEGLLEAISLLSAIENALEPRHIIIKSLCMRRLASSLVPFYKLWKREQMNR